MKTILFLKYNKVTDDAIYKMTSQMKNISIKIADLQKFGSEIDVLNYASIDKFLSNEMPFDGILFGDIFWPTGQNICLWASKNNVKSFFLQHGQWIYTKNKKNPRHTPTYTFVYGNNLKKEMSEWSYSKSSIIEVTGNPRYDLIKHEEHKNLNYIYFAPPVIFEKNPSAPDSLHENNLKNIELLRGIDNKFNVHIHPHYREGRTDNLKNIFPNATFINQNEDPLIYIKNCSKVLTHRNSTTILDAISSYKICVLCNFVGVSSHYPPMYFERFALESNSPSHCEELLREFFVVHEENYMDQAANFVLMGNASKKIECIIVKSFEEH